MSDDFAFRSQADIRPRFKTTGYKEARLPRSSENRYHSRQVCKLIRDFLSATARDFRPA
jgi:hypothetical protein